MTSEDFSEFISRLGEGDSRAGEKIVDNYYTKLVNIAKTKLLAIPPSVADDEGAVISAFRSFFSAVQKGQFKQLGDQDELWKLLVTITLRKSIAQIRRHHKKSGEGELVDRDAEVRFQMNLDPSPDQVVSFIDECEHLVSRLSSEKLRDIAILRLQGYESSEIAEKLNLHQRSVQRKLALIKRELAEFIE